MIPLPLAAFPIVQQDVAAWSDMDSFDHISNIVYFRYFQNARIEYLTRIGWFALKASRGMGPIVASTQARFRRPLVYPDNLYIGARAMKVDKDRVTFEHRLYSETWKDELVAEGQAVIVNYDYPSKTKADLPAELWEAIELLESRL